MRQGLSRENLKYGQVDITYIVIKTMVCSHSVPSRSTYTRGIVV